MRQGAKSWESMLKPEKMCQKMRKCVNTLESVSKHEKVCQNMRKCVKTWESVSKCERLCQNLRMCVKTWTRPVLDRLMTVKNVSKHVHSFLTAASCPKRDFYTPTPPPTPTPKNVQQTFVFHYYAFNAFD